MRIRFFTVFTFVLLVLLSLDCISQNAIMVKRQKKPLISAIYTPSGNFFASVGSDKIIKIWNSHSGNLFKSLYDNEEGEISVDFSPDGNTLVSGSWDNDVKVWDIDKGKVLKRFKAHTKSLRIVKFHPNGKLLASAGWDSEIIIWHVESGLIYQRLKGHDQCVRTIAFSPDGKYVATAGYDLKILIWEVSTGKQVTSINAHKMPIEALSYSPNGQRLASGSIDSKIKIWNPKTGILIKTLKGHASGIYSIEYSANGKYIASGSNDNTIKIWNEDTKEVISTFSDNTLSVRSVRFSPNGKNLLSSSFDRTIKIYKIEYLNITPTRYNFNTVPKEYTANSIIKFANQDNVTYKNNISLKAIIKDVSFSNYRIFINKKEYNFNKFLLKPDGNSSNNEYSELYYNVSLLDGNNEIFIYADRDNSNEFFITKPFNIYYQNLSKQTKTSNLYVLLINPPGFTDKKLNKEFSPNNTTNIKNKITSIKGKLYKDIIIKDLSLEENTTKEAINNSINEIKSKITPNDDLLILASSITVNKSGEYEYITLASNAKKEDLETNSFTINDLTSKFNNKPKNICLFIDITNRLGVKTKKYENIIPNDFNQYIFNTFNNNSYNIIVYKSPKRGKMFDHISNGLSKENDYNINKVIENNEVIQYIKASSTIYHSIIGRSIPLSVYN